MIVKSVQIEKFRGISDASFTLGKYVTLIAGQNGTQKSTLLGMVTQPFTITDTDNPLVNEKPLSGGNYKSSFKDKFRLSPDFDKPKEHEWTLFLEDVEEGFTVQSMLRSKASGDLRFWRKGNREAGSGYIQLPVIFLSLKRLLPIGEEDKISQNESVVLTAPEKKFFVDAYKDIMISDDNMESVDYVSSKNKETIGLSTDHYDWNANSAGQDNIGKILLAIISFKRLKEKYKAKYKGGILAIDEIDATLYPGSQVQLIKALCKYCSKFNIQAIATTHSLPMLEIASEIKYSEHRKEQVNIVYLKKMNKEVVIEDSLTFPQITNRLNASLGNAKKPLIDIFTEDAEARDLMRSLVGQKFKYLNYIDCTFGCGNLIDLARKKVPSFVLPNSIVVLDGDASGDAKLRSLNNFVCLPGILPPESMIAQFLSELDDNDTFWSSKHDDYTKQICFRNFKLAQIVSDRDKAKKWYNEQKKLGVWGRNCSAVYKKVLEDSPEEKSKFLHKFEEIYNKVAFAKGISIEGIK